MLRAIALRVAVVAFMVSLYLAGVVVGRATADGYYPPDCVDCDTAETGGVSEFANTGIDPVKAGIVLGAIGAAAVVVARRRATR